MRSAGMGLTKPAAGVIATSPATAPEIAPSTLGLPLRIHSAAAHPTAAAAAAKCVATKALVARLPARKRAARVESEPTHPQQARANKTQHDTVRRHRLFGISDAFAQIERADQRRNSRSDVNDGAACEIERRELAAQRSIQQAALAPNHVRHRVIHHDRPEHDEDQHRTELHALGKGTGNERRA